MAPCIGPNASPRNIEMDKFFRNMLRGGELQFATKTTEASRPLTNREITVKAVLGLATVALIASSAAYSAEMMSSVPSSSKTVSDWYKQDVYDPSNSKIGKVDDVLVSSAGQVDALVIGVGGFLGAGEKDVAVPFTAIKWTSKDNKNYLTMNATKDDLKSAQGLKYDSTKTAWVADTAK
jgi:sporulation protein YlmC with PRC-barrel domain